jgi:glycosyltransferase involved in cell wall biosynthesis
MKIETFTVCYNEEKMLPYFLRHYLQYGSVTVFDNNSTDRSVEIARALGATVFQFNSDDKYREDILTHLRNTCWRESKADWAIVTDVDEFVYHRGLELALTRSYGTVIMPRMFEMVSDVFPTTNGQIYEEVKMGVELRGKMCIFKPKDITAMNFDPGNHFARPEGDFKLDVKTEIITLHYKYLSLEYLIKRYDELNLRQSEENKLNNWSWHMSKSPEEFQKDFEEMKTRLIKVV